MFEEEFLKKFYRKYLEWVADGCPNANPHGFQKVHSLCWLIYSYAEVQGLRGAAWMVVLGNSFKKAGRDESLPFDKDMESFAESQKNGTLHQNFKRIKWAYDHAL